MNSKFKGSTIPLYEITAEKGTEKDSFCFRCVKPPTEDKMLIFLNKIYTSSNYSRILSMNRISAHEATSKNLPLEKDVVYGADYYEILCIDCQGEEKSFCITGINPPSPEDALGCINYSRADCEKMVKVVSVTPIDEAHALEHYEMGDWSYPFDLEE